MKKTKKKPKAGDLHLIWSSTNKQHQETKHTKPVSSSSAPDDCIVGVCCLFSGSRVLNKPINDCINVYRVLTRDHVTTNLSVCYGIKPSASKKTNKSESSSNSDRWSQKSFPVKLTVDQPKLAWRELQTYQSCCLGSKEEYRSRTVSLTDHATHFLISVHYLGLQHQSHICNITNTIKICLQNRIFKDIAKGHISTQWRKLHDNNAPTWYGTFVVLQDPKSWW